MRPIQIAALCLLTACEFTGGPPAPNQLANAEGPTRMTVSGDRVVSIVSPLEFGAIPSAARQACEAEAPGGVLLFCGVERGARGPSYRVEKQYAEPWPHERALLITDRGVVLEQGRTLPIARAPKHVLAAALRCGSYVERVEIVSSATGDEYWLAQVKDRRGQAYCAKITLDGTLDTVLHRTLCRVDS